MNQLSCFLLLSMCGLSLLKGQQLDSLVAQTQKLYDLTEKNLEFPNDQQGVDFSLLMVQDSTIADYQIALKEAQINVLKADYGLALNASAQLNTRGNLDIETNAFTTSRIKTELQWKFLKTGLVHNRNRIQQLKNDIEGLKLEKQLNELTKWRRQFRVQYNYSINLELIDLFTKKKKFLVAYYDIATELYSDKLIAREKVIDLGLQLSTCQTELQNTIAFNEQLKDSITDRIPFEKLPFISISQEEISAKNDSRTSLLQEILDKSDSLKAKNLEIDHHWTNHIRLDGYVNYNFLQTTIDHRKFASVGLKLSVPIRFKSQRLVIDATDQLNKAYSEESIQGQEHTRTTYLESYREKIRDLRNQHNNWKIISERKRVLWALKSEISDDKIGLNQLTLQEEQFAVLENCLRLKKQLYTSLAHLYEIDPNIQFQKLEFSQNAEKKAFISDTTQYSADFYLAFAKANNITTIYIPNKHSGWNEKFEKEGISVLPSLPNTGQARELNNWIQTEIIKLKTDS